jgi:biopolymer transport protein ExbD
LVLRVRRAALVKRASSRGLLAVHVQSSFGHEHHGIDLAPMLDFVINLLIFFIITAVFVKESGLTVRRPTSVDEPGASIDDITFSTTE